MESINIGASRTRLRNIAGLLLEACNDLTSDVSVTIYAADNNGGDEVILTFSNEDMEDRPELRPNTVIVSVD